MRREARRSVGVPSAVQVPSAGGDPERALEKRLAISMGAERAARRQELEAAVDGLRSEFKGWTTRRLELPADFDAQLRTDLHKAVEAAVASAELHPTSLQAQLDEVKADLAQCTGSLDVLEAISVHLSSELAELRAQAGRELTLADGTAAHCAHAGRA